MTWKVVNISNPGTSVKFGSDDLDKIGKLFRGDSNVDTVDINSTWKFRSGKMQVADSDNTNKTTFTSSNLTSDATINIPDISGGTYTLPLSGIANTLTQPLTIQYNGATDLMYLFKDLNTVSTSTDLNFDLYDSANNRTTYCDLRTSIEDNTDGSEDGKFEINVIRAGTKAAIAKFSGLNDLITLGYNQRIILDESNNTAARTYTFPDATTRLAGLAVANTFTGGTQTIQVGNVDALDLYRNTNSVGHDVGVDFALNDSTSTLTNYARIKGEIIDATNTSEDGILRFYTRRADVLTEAMNIDELGHVNITTNCLTTQRDAATLLELYRTTTGNGNDGEIDWLLKDSASNVDVAGRIGVEWTDNTSTSEDSNMYLYTRESGTLNATLTITNTAYLDLFHNNSTNFTEHGINFKAKDSGAANQDYGDFVCELQDTAAGSEDASFDWDLVRGGSTQRVMKLDNTGNLTLGRDISNQRGVPSCLNTNTDDVTFINSSAENTMSSVTVKGSTMGVDAQLEVKFFGYILQNSVTATTYTLRVKVGGTTIWAGAMTPAIAQDADKRPFYMEFNFFPSNQSSTTARMNGFVSINDGGTPTTGQGNIADDEIDTNGPIRAESITWTFANDTTVAFTIQMDQAQAATSWLMDAERWTIYPS